MRKFRFLSFIALAAFAINNVAWSQEPCSLEEVELALHVDGGGFAFGPSHIVKTGVEHKLSLVCNRGSPDLPLAQGAFNWVKTDSIFDYVDSATYTVAALSPGQVRKTTVDVYVDGYDFQQHRKIIEVELKGANAQVPRCTITAPFEAYVGTAFNATVSCNPAATSLKWVVSTPHSTETSVSIQSGENSSAASMFINQGRFGTFPIYLLASNAAGAAPVAGKSIQVWGQLGLHPKSLVPSFYQAILRRQADAGGRAYWDREAARMMDQGASINESLYALAMSFFGSPEYVSGNRDNAGYLEDLYRTFFGRAPEAAGFNYWLAQLQQGLPREVLMGSFMFSEEFRLFTENRFGAIQTRPEVLTVIDFYRGLLGRLPDDGGFAAWIAQFREAQCWKQISITKSVADRISGSFTNSPEYGARGRSNAQFVGDLYNAFMRRGGDLEGARYWINELNSGRRSREDVRKFFLASPEFAARLELQTQATCEEEIAVPYGFNGGAEYQLNPLDRMFFRFDPPDNPAVAAEFHLGNGYFVDAHVRTRQINGSPALEFAAPMSALSSAGRMIPGPVQVRLYDAQGRPSLVYNIKLNTLAPLDATPGASTLRLAARMKAISELSRANYAALQSASSGVNWTPRLNAIAVWGSHMTAVESVVNELRAGRAVTVFTRPDGQQVQVRPSDLPEIDRISEHFLRALDTGHSTVQPKLSASGQKNLDMLRRINDVVKGVASAASITLLGLGVAFPVALPEAGLAAGAVSVGGIAVVSANIAVAVMMGAFDVAISTEARLFSAAGWKEFAPVVEFALEELKGIATDLFLEKIQAPEIKWSGPFAALTIRSLAETTENALGADSVLSGAVAIKEISEAFESGKIDPCKYNPNCS